MPHYFRLERSTCQRPCCQKRADGTVFNGMNAPIGKFCEAHGEEEVAALNGAGERLDRPVFGPPPRASWGDRLR